jgi:hypothetical protein
MMMLTKDMVINQAIRTLQKTIRKGAASNEYMHESRSFQRARDKREIRKDVSRVNAEN